MPTREQRLQALEKKALSIEKFQTALVLILFDQPTPEQQAALDEAREAHRPVLVIRGQRVNFGQSDEITSAQEMERPDAFIYEKVPMREWH